MDRPIRYSDLDFDSDSEDEEEILEYFSKKNSRPKHPLRTFHDMERDVDENRVLGGVKDEDFVIKPADDHANNNKIKSSSASSDQGGRSKTKRKPVSPAKKAKGFSLRQGGQRKRTKAAKTFALKEETNFYKRGNIISGVVLGLGIAIAVTALLIALPVMALAVAIALSAILVLGGITLFALNQNNHPERIPTKIADHGQVSAGLRVGNSSMSKKGLSNEFSKKNKRLGTKDASDYVDQPCYGRIKSNDPTAKKGRAKPR